MLSDVCLKIYFLLFLDFTKIFLLNSYILESQFVIFKLNNKINMR